MEKWFFCEIRPIRFIMGAHAIFPVWFLGGACSGLRAYACAHHVRGDVGFLSPLASRRMTSIALGISVPVQHPVLLTKVLGLPRPPRVLDAVQRLCRAHSSVVHCG